MQRAVTRPRTGNVIRSEKVLRRRSRVHQALLDKGARLFAAKGVEQVSVEELIEAVGISRRTFYGFFANKYELVAGILTPVFEAGVAELATLAEGPADQIVPGIVRAYWTLWREYQAALEIITRLDSAVFPYIEQQHRAFGAALKAALERAEASGRLRNRSADYSFRVLTRTAIPLLKVYRDHPDREALYTESMTALLGAAR
jgi:AcrR family transcriptional regulator